MAHASKEREREKREVSGDWGDWGYVLGNFPLNAVLARRHARPTGGYSYCNWQMWSLSLVVEVQAPTNGLHLGTIESHCNAEANGVTPFRMLHDCHNLLEQGFITGLNAIYSLVEINIREVTDQIKKTVTLQYKPTRFLGWIWRRGRAPHLCLRFIPHT